MNAHARAIIAASLLWLAPGLAVAMAGIAEWAEETPGGYRIGCNDLVGSEHCVALYGSPEEILLAGIERYKFFNQAVAGSLRDAAQFFLLDTQSGALSHYDTREQLEAAIDERQLGGFLLPGLGVRLGLFGIAPLALLFLLTRRQPDASLGTQLVEYLDRPWLLAPGFAGAAACFAWVHRHYSPYPAAGLHSAAQLFDPVFYGGAFVLTLAIWPLARDLASRIGRRLWGAQETPVVAARTKCLRACLTGLMTLAMLHALGARLVDSNPYLRGL